MNLRLSLLIAALSAGFMLIGPAKAAIIITAVETAGNVVFSTPGGTLDLTGLTLYGSGSIWGGGVNPKDGTFSVGDDSGRVDVYTGFSGPTSIGPSFTTTLEDFGSGPLIGFDHCCSPLLPDSMVVPTGYVSGALLGPASQTYLGQTFSSMGLTPDTYVWSWSGDSITLNIIPVPAAAWLFGSALGLLGWIRRRSA